MDGIGDMEEDLAVPNDISPDYVLPNGDDHLDHLVHDGMLNNENEALADRVITLEKKVLSQEDEIVCLKSALSDVIRRLQALESGRAQNSLLPSKPRFSGSSARRSMPLTTKDSTTTRRAASHEAVNQARYSSPIPNRVVPRSSPGPPPASKRWPSSPTMNTNVHVDTNGHMSPNRRTGSLGSLTGRLSPAPFPIRYREPSFSQDEKCLRFYLRGRSLNFYAPSSTEDYQVTKALSAPQEKLKLEWVYGYRGRDARSNLFLLPTGEMVYFVAAVVVLYNVEEQMQRHYLGHTDDVKCIAIHPDRLRIATGQVAGHDKREGRRKNVEFIENPETLWLVTSTGSKKKDRMSQPHIRIWNSVNLQTLKIIGIGDFDRAVSCVAFSKLDGGQYLVAVDEANEHVISLWDWEKGQKLTETKSSTEPVLASEFHPCERNIIVTCGKGQISFWTLDGNTLTRKLGIYERNDKGRFVTCLAFAENGDVLSGDSNGNFYVWGRGTNKITQGAPSAHDGGLFSICVMKDGTILTGGKDRKILQWTSAYKRTGVEHELPDQYGGVRMLNQGRGNVILVGTTKNVILHGSLDLKFSAIVQGHTDELWGLACHPNQHQFVTCGYDRTLFLWDILTHSAIWSRDLPDGANCCCFSPDGSLILVGTLCGRWVVIELTSREVVTSHTDGSEPLACMAFSPDGSMFAVGSRDNIIYVYTVDGGGRKYTRQGKCTGHSSFLTHLDWSSDGQFLQSTSGDYELLFWNASTCRQITSASSMRDVEWATQTCTLGFGTCGIWPEGADGTDVNACSRSHSSTLLASADDFGKVNLFSYPCSQPRSTGHIYNGHSSHVTNVEFIHDDMRLVSTGGKDTAVFQWEVLG